MLCCELSQQISVSLPGLLAPMGTVTSMSSEAHTHTYAGHAWIVSIGRSAEWLVQIRISWDASCRPNPHQSVLAPTMLGLPVIPFIL